MLVVANIWILHLHLKLLGANHLSYYLDFKLKWADENVTYRKDAKNFHE
jgi:hypothetical protein